MSSGYLAVGLSLNKKSKTRTVHQLVAITFLNHIQCGHNLVVDHIDEDNTNNKLSNLRIYTNRENLSRRGGTSGYAGVSFHKARGKWLARIRIKDKRINLGYFKDEVEASKMYQTALKNIELHNGNNKEFIEIIK